MGMVDLFYNNNNTSETEPTAPLTLLKPESCESSSRIRAFLRLSRIATDDTIRQHLNEIPRSKCDEYFNRKIVPQWRARSEVITFCSNYAKEIRLKVELRKAEAHNDHDLRIDPYALKNELSQLEEQTSKCTTIENWIHNESGVEAIIRAQTADVLNDKCYYKDWLAAFKKSV